MIFSDLYKSPRSTLTKFRNSFPHGPAPLPADVDADLVSRDKARNKEAVRKFLSEKIRNDWDFTWPSLVVAQPPSEADAAAPAQEEATPATTAETAVDDYAPKDPGEEADSESDAESVYSTISEDAQRFRSRADWTSDLSDNDEPVPPASPFRFDSPDAVGAAIFNSAETKRARRRRAVRDEAKWNPGLACFEARRNAWTGAKTVRVKPKPASPVSPSSGRRLFWRHHRSQSSVSHSGIITSGSPPGAPSPLQPAAARTSTTTASESDSVGRTTSQDSNPPTTTTTTTTTTTPTPLYPVHTLLPLPAPLLPPQNPMRASIQPSMYGSLYDKVVAQSLQPSCPVNLADMLRACVVGWKRDGEWPPRPAYAAPPAAPAALQMHHHQEALAARQRRAQAQLRAAKSAEQPGAGRRLSLVGFFNGGGGGGAAPAAPTPAKSTPQEGREKEKEQSHSDEGAGSSGKALFRRSLQRVFSLGQHGHGQTQQQQTQQGGGNPASPAGEVTAAG
ncbi:hypothetical protein C8A05DRAFT_15928 [Staphylotrichum tortipilum]|uniref:Gag1-like clamp domain-containing protein n=1 Tax=Staphylotrichum tortipilum TaxID=2831512 RepID=A0AAN6MKZ3_9PEZI|nr:hypothetical protein C8A05DRAFT_15928 [Staphylotrichum longicolle]